MSTRFDIDLSFTVYNSGTDEEFDRHTDEVLDHLSDLDGILEADMTVSLTDRTVKFHLWVEGQDQAGALGVAFARVRTAVHAQGGYTGGWDEGIAQAVANVRPSEAREPVAV